MLTRSKETFYPVFRVNGAGRIDRTLLVFDASSDAEAIFRATKFAGASAVELWSGARRVATFERHRATSTAA